MPNPNVIEERLQKGLCTRCGNVNDRKDLGFKTCTRCKTYQQRWRNKSNEQSDEKVESFSASKEDMKKLADKFNQQKEKIRKEVNKAIKEKLNLEPKETPAEKKVDMNFRIPEYLRLKLLAEYEHEGYTDLNLYVSDILSMYFDNKKVFDNVFRSNNKDCIYQTEQVFIRIAKESYKALVSTVNSIEIQLND